MREENNTLIRAIIGTLIYIIITIPYWFINNYEILYIILAVIISVTLSPFVYNIIRKMKDKSNGDKK